MTAPPTDHDNDHATDHYCTSCAYLLDRSVIPSFGSFLVLDGGGVANRSDSGMLSSKNDMS